MGVVRIDGMPFVVVRCRTASACPWHPRASVQTYVVQHAAVQTRRAARCPPCPMMLLSCQSKSRTRMAAQYSVLQRCCTPLVQQPGAGAGAPAAVTRQPLGTRPSVDHHWTRRVTWCTMYYTVQFFSWSRALPYGWPYVRCPIGPRLAGSPAPVAPLAARGVGLARSPLWAHGCMCAPSLSALSLSSSDLRLYAEHDSPGVRAAITKDPAARHPCWHSGSAGTYCWHQWGALKAHVHDVHDVLHAHCYNVCLTHAADQLIRHWHH